ncbi:S8 family serine peptidase [Roseomonas gilardii]|uniref:S8 family serine peptidase n=1 Tax=Roseomonas gilardii TaxID=257708 RepID=UPI0011A33363|nr:S8 family serine peptidase [Roseomonas gilardii]
MTADGSRLLDELTATASDAEVAAGLGYREDLPDLPGAPEATARPVDPRAAISGAAYDFVLRWETGGRDYYERVIGGRPAWPGYASGITIGCGYDLGYHRPAEFRADWGGRIAPAELERLATTIGFRTTEPDRAAKVETARGLVASLADIVVPWTVAIAQFDAGKLPVLVGKLYGALDNLDLLHPHARGALLSLVFNRGASFALAGPRFAEMRAIAEAMAEGSPAAFARIPGLLRDMRRIWGPESSLSRRREGEARLFEAGLAEGALLRGTGRVEAAIPGAALAEDLEDSEGPQTDEAEEAPPRAGPETATPAIVRWHASDDEQPDYRHLDTRLAGRTAEILPEDIEALIAANAFEPEPGAVVLALRGALLVGGPARMDAPSLVITDQRPDHRDFRCVMGSYDPRMRRFSAWQASTVPNAEYVLQCHRDFQSGVRLESLTGNILPTGCYTMTVGTHRRGKPGEIPGVLRLSTTADGASRVVVLRSLEDACYDRFDRFVEATPGDNIHPAQRAPGNGFSSAGCLTLPGRYRDAQHTGAWREFRAALGFDETTPGRQYSMLLLTGLDAVMAAEARRAGTGSAALRRLRHGSRGPLVGRLQAALGLRPDAAPVLGPVTRAVLARAQAARLGWADAVHSPEMDALLGFRVFAEGPEAAGRPEAGGRVPAGEPGGDLAPVLEAWRAERAAAAPVRFVASFAAAPPDAGLAAAASARLGLPVAVRRLFGPDPDLDRFRLLEVERVSRPERAELFDLAAALREATGAEVVQPDLGTDHYRDEGQPRRAGPEGADAAVWCWAPDRERPAISDWAIEDTGIRKAWQRAAAGPGQAKGQDILVFQPDTGVVGAHAEVPPGIAHDPRAANFVEEGGPAEDPMTGGSNPGHGTGTGSVVASPEGGRMTGAAPAATLVPIRCIESVARFEQSAVARAIDHARRAGAHVITMSLGGVPSIAMHAALRRAVEENVIVAAAAGNCVGEVVWPARYDAAIAVGGVNAAMKPWRGSSHGPAVDICGPAEFVLRANARDAAEPLAAVGGGQGTSFATALLAGIAALWLAHHGRAALIAALPPGRRLQDMFRALLRRTATVPPGHDAEEYGAGVVNADALLAADFRTAFTGAEAPPRRAAPDEADIAGIAELVARVHGAAGREAAGAVLRSDPQHALEIACAALDRARAAGSARAILEGRPPPDLSVALRRRLGAAATDLR